MSYPDPPEQAKVIVWKGEHLVVFASDGNGKITTLRRSADRRG